MNKHFFVNAHGKRCNRRDLNQMLRLACDAYDMMAVDPVCQFMKMSKTGNMYLI